jgi:pimeloyl-ACP methyl ester carboxylesterase
MPSRSLPTDSTRATLARDVVALWDALGIDAAHVFGNPLGGPIGYERLARALGEVRSLTTFDHRGARLVMEAIPAYEYTPFLRTQTLPLMLVRGPFDAEIDAQLASTLAALRETRRSTLVDLPGTGHFANHERPAAFDRLLGRFLARVDDARRPRPAPGQAPRRVLQPA